MITVTLSPEELAHSHMEGARRNLSNIREGRSPRNGSPMEGPAALYHHILGSLGEMAVAVHLGLKEHLYAEERPVHNSVDLPPNIDVKTTDSPGKRLIVQLDDSPTKVFVLATCARTLSGIVGIHGYINATKAMNNDWRENPTGNRPAYFIPISVLNPQISDLQKGGV